MWVLDMDLLHIPDTNFQEIFFGKNFYEISESENADTIFQK